MSKSDAEMEDAEKIPNESGEKAQEATQGDNTKIDNGDEYLKKCSEVAQGVATEKSEVAAQIHPDGEAVEPTDTALEPVAEQNNDEVENVDLIQSETNGEEQTGDDSAVEKQADANDELAAQNVTNGGLVKVQSTDNRPETGNYVENMVGKPGAGNVGELPSESNGINQDYVENAAQEKSTMEVNDAGIAHGVEAPPQSDISINNAAQSKSAQPDEILQVKDKEMEDAAAGANEDKSDKDVLMEQGKEMPVIANITDQKSNMIETSAHFETDESSHPNQQEPATPKSFVNYSPSMDGDHSGQAVKSVFSHATLPLMAEGDDGTPEEQAGFMKELESFYRGRAMDFKPPKFYGQPLNCLKLWRSVIRLGGYDRVTQTKLWRQVGESFHPPKTCTTVSWTFRIFYEKSLLEFERHKKQCGELQLPVATIPEAPGVENEGNGYQGAGSVSGRARRDAAARAMQGWHVQRILDNGEVGEPVIKDKNANNPAKREKNLKSIGSIKQKRPNEGENPNKVARTESFKQLVTSVVDVGPPADWVKINIRQTKDCFEVYALVPGLLREEVRVQSDPAGRLVITGQPEQVENPWGITPFKKVVTLPGRIDPLQTSAVVSLHGRLFVRVPFEQPNV